MAKVSKSASRSIYIASNPIRGMTVWPLRRCCAMPPGPDWSMHHHAPLRPQHFAHVRAQTTTEETAS